MYHQIGSLRVLVKRDRQEWIHDIKKLTEELSNHILDDCKFVVSTSHGPDAQVTFFRKEIIDPKTKRITSVMPTFHILPLYPNQKAAILLYHEWQYSVLVDIHRLINASAYKNYEKEVSLILQNAKATKVVKTINVKRKQFELETIVPCVTIQNTQVPIKSFGWNVEELYPSAFSVSQQEHQSRDMLNSPNAPDGIGVVFDWMKPKLTLTQKVTNWFIAKLTLKKEK